ncbi:hypothetical protein, variant [Saprolegnia diclina VS20]|uniref:START domain-containing protein n=1 Tax=Saprolegnia diclina (strain VS20) TaxID=1156394 RepID=T0QTI2_SAPDV|nr:hypothetical protein, variant [Saprolegnia diclina VS20]EQC37330.1 hypothetical protein, variant [Saprolegnia diclina VS20]|eukprot:XP_008609492.1 hypothetical protein, variant [Saprolegnia diclina VS20]
MLGAGHTPMRQRRALTSVRVPSYTVHVPHDRASRPRSPSFELTESVPFASMMMNDSTGHTRRRRRGSDNGGISRKYSDAIGPHPVTSTQEHAQIPRRGDRHYRIEAAVAMTTPLSCAPPEPASTADVIATVFADFELDQPSLPPRPPRVDRQKEELVYLRQQVEQLNAILVELTSSRMVDDLAGCTFWEKIARDQKMASTRASQENGRLKRALEDQLHVAKELERLLVKRPRLAEPPSLDLADWKLRRLPLDEVSRSAAFHAIVDDAFANLESLFLRSRILEAPIGQRLFNVTEDRDSILISVKNVIEIPDNVLSVGEKTWTTWRGCSGTLPHMRFEVLQSFGVDGVYVRITTSLDATTPCMQLNYAIKRFVRDSRVVFVLKTVLDDEKLPVLPGLLVGNHTACIVMEAVGANRTCRRVCVEGNLPAQPPRHSPLLQKELSVTDAVFKMMQSVFQTLEMLLA